MQIVFVYIVETIQQLNLSLNIVIVVEIHQMSMLIQNLIINNLNNLKMAAIDFILGFCSGGLVMWAVGRTVLNEWKKDLEKLKDFETWKEWKNK